MNRYVREALLTGGLVALGVSVAVVVLGLHGFYDSPTPAPADPGNVIIMWPEEGRPDYQEDDPEFDCRIDGDMVCSPVDWWAVRMIVNDHDRCMRGMIGLRLSPELCEILLTEGDAK
jgi:hypothetical protein